MPIQGVDYMSLPTIKLTDREFRRIFEWEYVNCGSEAVICRTESPNELYKFFTYPDFWHPSAHYANKVKKLNSIHDKAIKHITEPRSIAKVDDDITGYRVACDPLDIALDKLKLGYDDSYYYLVETLRILNYFASRNFIYSDVRSDNILINPQARTVKFCDVDNTQVDDLLMDCAPDILCSFHDSFFGKGHDASEPIDTMYMFNLLTLQQLSYQDAEYEDILKELNSGKLPANYSKEAYRVIESMLTPKEFTGESILQYVKK